MRIILTSLLLLTAACAESAGLSIANEAGPPEDTGYFADPEAGVDDDDLDQASADLMAFDGTLVIADGQVDTTQSALLLTVFDGSELLCTGPLVLATTTATVPADDTVAASSYWNVSAVTESPDGCWLPSSLSFSLGAVPYDASLEPAAETAGFEDAAMATYGAVVQLNPEGDTYLFGVLGTEEQFDGDAASDPSAPLVDGVYTLRTLYLLPLIAG